MVGGFSKYGYLAAQYTIAQGVVTVRVRATSTAVLIFMQNMIGYSLGPLFIGAISDHLFKVKVEAMGLTGQLTFHMCDKPKGISEAMKAACEASYPHALQTSMLICACIYALAGAFLLLACRWLNRDMIAKPAA